MRLTFALLVLGACASMPGADAREVRWLSPSDATTVYGTGHSAGAIAVILKH